MSKPDLSQFDEDYSTAEAPSFDEIPDGKYQVRIDGVRLAETHAGVPMIKWDLLIIAGSQEGRRIFKNSVITSASLPFVKGDLHTLGLSLTKFSELSERLEDLLDATLEVNKRTRGDYSNVYFNKRIEIASAPEEDSIPF